MKPAISIGANVYRLRKKARLTQDELASYLGVTKASVSKWETGQSYPDIELLPRIATYFGATVDELLGYEPQLPKDGIRRECERLGRAFATEPFAQAHTRCRELVREYYSCYPLLVQVAALYLNHLDLAEGPARDELCAEAIGLCRRVRRNADLSATIKQAEAIEASLYLVMGNPREAVGVLEDACDVDMGADLLLADAYRALGQVDKADMTLQGTLLQAVVLSVNRLAQLALLYVGDMAKLDIAHERACALIGAFDLETLYVNCAGIHLSFAMAYMMGGNAPRALDCLEDYERACRLLEFPVKLHGDSFFDKAERWLEDVNDIGSAVPLEDGLIKKRLLESVTANPAFAPLADEPRFRRIVAGLQGVVR